MGKKNTVVKLYGVLANGREANTSEAGQVVAYEDVKKNFRVQLYSDSVTVLTAKGSYSLPKEYNMYRGKCGGITTHFTHKKIVGKLIYWA